MPQNKPLLLLVEDEALLVAPLEAELTEAGFEVVVALNGSKGIAELEVDPTRFSGPITDIRLPAVDGWTIATRARELMPTIPVVYMSGDSAADWAAYGVPDSIMLSKPIAAAQLIAAVAKLINEVPPAERGLR
jgi:two-component system, OmpR family, response regulator